MKHKFLLFIFPLAFAFIPVFGANATPHVSNPELSLKKEASQPRFDRAAIGSLALGISTVLVFTLSPLLAIGLGCSAFLCGRQATKHIQQNPEKLRGKGMAVAGIVISSAANPLGFFFLGGSLIGDELKKWLRRKKQPK